MRSHTATAHRLNGRVMYLHWRGKKRSCLTTLVERHTSCIVGWRVCADRDKATLQRLLTDSPQAARYYSNLFAPYKALVYSPGTHTELILYKCCPTAQSTGSTFDKRSSDQIATSRCGWVFNCLPIQDIRLPGLSFVNPPS